MTEPESQMTTQTKDPDPEGDLQLVIGSEDVQTSIRVSSQVFRRPSPVLSAMLDPRYAKRQKLADEQSLGVSSIALPDDDPEAMVWFCHAIHLQKCATEKVVTFDFLRKIATLSDKYELSVALHAWSEMWMQMWPGTDREYPELLWISYALGHHGKELEVAGVLGGGCGSRG